MAITFDCECGKNFKVKDENAGKKTKCPTCGTRLTVPDLELNVDTKEDEAFKALSEGPEPERNADHWRNAPSAFDSPSMMPEPFNSRPVENTAPIPKPKKKVKTSYDETERKWNIDWGTVGGGGIAILLGTGLLVGGLAANRFFIWSPVIIIGGLISVINGLLHKE